MPCSCGKNASYRRRGDKSVLTSIGHVTVERRYYACRHCGATQTPWDVWAGVGGRHRVTYHARQMVVLAGSDMSFDKASDRLRKLCRLEVSNDVVRRVCDEEGKRVQDWIKASPQPVRAFTEAEGEVEFSSDGIKVNTTDGWRDLRLNVFSKREPGTPAAPHEWDDRVLNDPTVRVAWCAIARCAVIGSSWGQMAERLGLIPGQALSVLADGARWIWDQAAKRFKDLGSMDRGVEWVVDVYHLMLYLHAFAAARPGESADKAAEAWARERIVELIGLGGPKFIERLKQTGPGTESAAALKAWEKLLGYLADNRDSLWYGERLKRGQPIGTGLIEGGCKNIIAARLKLNSARWRVRRAERMGAIRCMQYSDLWDPYWADWAAA